MSAVKVFFCEPTERMAQWLRRYSSSPVRKCTTGHYCDAMYRIEDAPAVKSPQGYLVEAAELPHEDPRWPVKCEKCGVPFDVEDHHQVFSDSIYRRTDGGAEFPLREAPAGACWDSWWYRDIKAYVGPDGRSLTVALPPNGGMDYWVIDGPSSNGNGWTRTGKPEDGTLDVNPSILTPRYHGFLRNGFLVPC
jgi:hypothetical protein